jgi:hypothetical protein
VNHACDDAIINGAVSGDGASRLFTCEKANGIARCLRPLPSLITARCDPFNVDAFRPLRFNPSNRSQEGCGHARLEVG